MAESNIMNGIFEEMQSPIWIIQECYHWVSMTIDARDGLSFSQRRVLYDMRNLRIFSDRSHRKSARIVGDTMGNIRMETHLNIPTVVRIRIS